VLPFFEEHDVKLMRVLTDRGSEFCGYPERHEYERTKTKSPQTNGICEPFHKNVLNEFYRVAFRKKLYRSIDKPIWTRGSENTTRQGHIRDVGVLKRPRCRLSRMQCRWQRRVNDRSLIAWDITPDRSTGTRCQIEF
jgi:hypothetical protein